MKKFVSVVISLLLLLTAIPLGAVSVSAASYDSNVVVNLALSKVGSSYANGYCLSFVKELFASAYGFTSTACCAYRYGTQFVDSTSRDDIPLGASVFFAGSSITCGTCNNKCGHIGIYVGDDYVVHAWDGRVEKFKISRILNVGYSYLGWGFHGNVELTSTPHTHNYSTYVYYWAEHPHYKCYQCSCGDVVANYSEPTTISGCSSCTGDYEYAMFPMTYLNVTQGVNGSFSHQGTKAIDIAGKDTGIDAAYAPFTGVVKRIYQDYVVWLESSNPVMYADGTVDYMTIMVMHDNDTSDLYVGKEVKQGEHFFDEGTTGYATGNHIHLECAKGKFQGNGWYENSQGNWVIYNHIEPYNALFLSSDTVVTNGYGYNWKYVTSASPHSHTYDNDCDADCNECGETRTPTDHTYDNDCDADCNECGGRREVEHNFRVVEVEATCSEYGKRCYTCGICGYYYEEIIADDASDWSVEYPSNVEPELVESKIEYRYREWMETTEPLTEDGWILDSTYTRLGDYGAWSGWTDTALSGNDTTQVETRTVYPYYYFKCPNCGAHMHVYLGCYTWAGGCGKSGISSGDYVQIDSTVSYVSAGVKDFHGTGRNYTYLDGQLVFQHRDGSKTQYRSRTKELETVYRYYRYTDWAEWSEECSASDAMTEERTVYRYVIADLADHTYDDDYDADCNVCGVLREVPEKPTPDLPADAPAFVVDSVTAREGEEFTVAIRTQRNSGIVSLKLKVGYDAAVLELVSVAEQDFTGMSFGSFTNNPFIINWVDAIHPNNTTDGVVALVTFRVKEGAKGTAAITLTYDAEDVYDQNYNNVAFRIENGTVTVVEYTPGDVNGDGKINNKDLGMLQQYVNEWEISLTEAAADCNGDGRINNKDLGLLQQYVNEWDVTLG